MRFLQSMTAAGGSDGFPFDLPSVAALADSLSFHPKVTFFVGENGTGKSTILEGLADKWGFSMQSGNRSQSLHSREYQTALAPHLTLSRSPNRPLDGFFLRAESFYNFASELDALENEPFCGTGYFNYGGKSLHQQSHGESFFAVFNHRLGDHGFYILDEPEAALSPSRQLAFLVRLNDLVQDELCQFVIATHSPIIMAYPDAWIYEVSERGIKRVTYEETAHYHLTKRFLDHREHMFAQLFSREEEEEE